MQDTIRVDTDALLSVASRLDRVAQDMKGVHLPSADGIGNGQYAATLRAQRDRLAQLAAQARDCGQRTRKAEQILTACERSLTFRSELATRTGSVVDTGLLETWLPTLLSLAKSLLTGGLKGLVGAQAFQLLENWLWKLSKGQAMPEEMSQAEKEACEAQRKLALEIYDHFSDGMLADELRKQGYSTVTIEYPAGIAAYRMGADGVPEIQIVYRGSQSVEDWISNFAFSSNSEGFHIGFADSAAQFLQQLHSQPLDGLSGNTTYGQLLEAASQGQPIRVSLTGHSRGAAEAQLTAASLLKSGIPTQNVTAYTFATPVVATAHALQQPYLQGAQIHNLVNQWDYVVRNVGADASPLVSATGNLGVTYEFNGNESVLKPFTAHRFGYESIAYEDL